MKNIANINDFERVFILGQISDFFINNSTQVWTLISVAFGGVVTYLSTSAAEKRKDKKSLQRDKMAQILIPYCTCLEETIENLGSIYICDDFYGQNDIDKWFEKLKKPVEYLSASKRVYLCKKSRILLEKYKESLYNFEIAINKECETCLIAYKNYIADVLSSFPNVRTSMLILFGMRDVVSIKVKLAIIRKSNLSLIYDFSSIDFVHNDDPDNYQTTTVSLNEEAKSAWGAINCSVMDIGDIEDPEIELACILLDFFSENVLSEKHELERIINRTTGSLLLNQINDDLVNIKKILIKQIDKIAN